MGSYTIRNARYMLYLLARSFLISVAVLLALSLYWGMLGSGPSEMSGQPFFILIAVLVPLMLCYQNTAVYLNLSLGACNTRRSAFAAMQIVKLAAAAAFGLLGTVTTELITYFVSGRFSFDGALFGVTALFVVFAMSAGELLGSVTHRFGRIGAIVFGLFCALVGGCIGVFISLAPSSEEIGFQVDMLTALPFWCCLAVLLLAVCFTALTWFCFMRRYVVK